MVCAYSASQRTSSSSTPSASATMRTASPNTAVPCAVIAWRSGSSIGRPKPTGHLGRGRVVERRVRRLVDGDLVDAVADASPTTMANSSTKPGLMPVPNIVEPPLLARVDDPVAAVTLVVAGDERRRRHDVHARRQDAHQLVDVDPHRVVDDAVGLQREQRVDVVGGGHAERLDAAQLADVAADLVRRPGVAPDELESRVARRWPATELLPTLPVVHWTTRYGELFGTRSA